MSLVLNTLPADGNVGAWDSVKNGVVDAAKWCNRQVQWLLNAIKDYALSAYNWAKPYFISLKDFVTTQYQNLKDLVVQNKETSMILVGIAALIAVFGLGYKYCCPGDSKSTSDAKTTTQSA